MHRERLSEDIFVFTSALYAQATAGVIITPEGAIVIDTLPFPSETQEMVDFITSHSPRGVRYVILTHYHADHVYGMRHFRGAEMIAHARCRHLLAERTQPGLEAARAHTAELGAVEIWLPGLVFENGDMTLRLGDKTLQLIHLPGHSEDLVAVYVKDDKILFASDAVMPVPHIVDGDPVPMIESLRRVEAMNTEMIVQGHGELILRGEINGTLSSNIKYLEVIQVRVRDAIAAGRKRQSIQGISIEACGKSRIPLNGLVQRLHLDNLLSLYDRGTGGGPSSDSLVV
ncbi:MAG: MBL fold metallo-hydrolase [Thermoflexales bacterium]|nr:MBL fold metallo-hydrolase [Thermoflexales bacterium]